jgi:hypothetical protein
MAPAIAAGDSHRSNPAIPLAPPQWAYPEGTTAVAAGTGGLLS